MSATIYRPIPFISSSNHENLPEPEFKCVEDTLGPNENLCVNNYVTVFTIM